MSPKTPSNSSIRVACNKPECAFELQKDTWLDSRALKGAGVILGLLTPLFVWIVLTIFNVKEDVSLIKLRQDTFNNTVSEIKSDLKEIRSDLNIIKINMPKEKVASIDSFKLGSN